MGWKIFISFLFIVVSISMLILYWFVPFTTTEFGTKSSNYNFSLNNNETKNMQFYENMRYPSTKISYKINDCPLQKTDDMKRAFEIISNETILEFHPKEYNEEISITCDSKNKIEGGLFIAGEGGPTNITKAGKFNVILHGKILLIRESQCEKPTIALHELLHVLGFNHSDNSNNIMYPINKCQQTIGSDIIELINKIYSIPSYPDLIFENVSAIMHGKYLNTNISIRNSGLKNSENIEVLIYANEKLAKKIELNRLEIGYGITITLENIWVRTIDVSKLEFVIEHNFDELDKDNNKVILDIKE